MTTIHIVMPRGPEGEVDLDSLTPKARAVAEAIAQTGLKRIRVRRDATDDPDQPDTVSFDGWTTGASRETLTLTQLLEWEARKIPPGWAPVADDGSDLPTTVAALADDGITRDQAMAILDECGVWMVDIDTWMRNATKGTAGFPAPVRHNGSRSLWSDREVREFAELVGRAAKAGTRRHVARDDAARASKDLRPLVLDLLGAGMEETLVARIARVDRQVVRTWTGK